MKILTILGTRPEIIRLSRIIPALDGLCEHVVAHTGQNFDRKLSDIFFEELGVRKPDYFFNTRVDTLATQVGHILAETEQLLEKVRPDRLLVLGDTNSALSAFIAKRMGIPVYHMEAGNRCYDDRVPEEVNRRVIDHCSDVLMPYTERSRVNLVREGIEGTRILVTGNPIYEVLQHYRPRIDASDVHARLGVEAGQYVLATFHRAENVDVPDRLRAIVEGLRRTAATLGMPVVCSVHPRTRIRLQQYYLEPTDAKLILLEPLGFFDFVALEKDAHVVITDSGTVQEECCILGVPGITIRDTTERPETVECGSNALAGVDPANLVRLAKAGASARAWWTVPREYLEERVSSTVVNIVLGYNNRAPTPIWTRTGQAADAGERPAAHATGGKPERAAKPATGTRGENPQEIAR